MRKKARNPLARPSRANPRPGKLVRAASWFLLSTLALSVHAAPQCDLLGYNQHGRAKPNKLYLYFPQVDDWTFPDFGDPGTFSTTPARAFDVARLASYQGTETALRNAIFDVVSDAYCAFNIEVIATRTAPTTLQARRNTVAIGSDSQLDADMTQQWGQAQGPDAGDQTAVDFARLWAGTYQDDAGQPGGALEGARSTVERWARSIGGTAVHEAAHNYGLLHSDGYLLGAGEDDLVHHLMADGRMFDNEARAGYPRHFSDHEYTMLASNVGLSVQTVLGWVLTNPNQQAAEGFTIDLLSLQPALALAAVYAGPLSPWERPSLDPALPHTATFKGVQYYHYRLTWSVPKTWNGGQAGVVGGGEDFQLGASFSTVDPATSDPIIVMAVSLKDGSGTALPLNPRIPAFDAPVLNPTSGVLEIDVYNNQAAPFALESATVQFLPRLASLDAMLPLHTMHDPLGVPMTVWEQRSLAVDKARRLVASQSFKLAVARLKDGRRTVRLVDAASCAASDTRGSHSDTVGCKPGINVSLFPATSTLLTVQAIDQNAWQWSARAGTYVTAPLRTTAVYQFVGKHPDLNHNGIDDYIDIVTGRAKDRRSDWLIHPLVRRR